MIKYYRANKSFKIKPIKYNLHRKHIHSVLEPNYQFQYKMYNMFQSPNRFYNWNYNANIVMLQHQTIHQYIDIRYPMKDSVMMGTMYTYPAGEAQNIRRADNRHDKLIIYVKI
jgi:tRNA(Leu) C34 or U34 (ribose-2'-O)-methylase TrmL